MNKSQELPRWVKGTPQQPGIYMTTLLMANGARTCAPMSYHSGRFYCWYDADAALQSRGAKIIAYYAIPQAFEGGSA